MVFESLFLVLSIFGVGLREEKYHGIWIKYGVFSKVTTTSCGASWCDKGVTYLIRNFKCTVTVVESGFLFQNTPYLIHIPWYFSSLRPTPNILYTRKRLSNTIIYNKIVHIHLSKLFLYNDFIILLPLQNILKLLLQILRVEPTPSPHTWT